MRMRDSFWFLVGMLLSFLLIANTAFAEIPQKADGYVNDFANVIGVDKRQALEKSLRDFEKATTNEIAVVTIPSLEGLTVEDYAVRLFEKWKVGKKGKNNGAIMLLAPKERKTRIEVGYGLESVLTDAHSKRILEKMKPYFKKGDYAGGFEVGIKNVIALTSPPATQDAIQPKEEKKSSLPITALLIIGGFILFVAIILILWVRSTNRKEEKEDDFFRQSPRVSSPPPKKSSTDEGAGFLAGAVVGSLISHHSDDEDRHSHNDDSSHYEDSSGSSDFGGFGGGDSGGGGASGDF